MDVEILRSLSIQLINWYTWTLDNWFTPLPPLLDILNILKIGIIALVLVNKYLKALEAKDQDVQKRGTKIEQRELPCMEEFDEATSNKKW